MVKRVYFGIRMQASPHLQVLWGEKSETGMSANLGFVLLCCCKIALLTSPYILRWFFLKKKSQQLHNTVIFSIWMIRSPQWLCWKLTWSAVFPGNNNVLCSPDLWQDPSVLMTMTWKMVRPQKKEIVLYSYTSFRRYRIRLFYLV